VAGRAWSTYDSVDGLTVRDNKTATRQRQDSDKTAKKK